MNLSIQNNPISPAVSFPVSTGGAEFQPSGGSEPVEGPVCIANISTRERRGRLVVGIVQFVTAIAVLGVLVALHLDLLWRLPLFLLFAAAAVGFFQWRDKTCVAHARLGTRKLTDRLEKIEDAAELAQVRRQARKVVFKATLVAIPLTLLALLLPR